MLAAVNGDIGAGDEGGFVGGQISDEACNFIR